MRSLSEDPPDVYDPALHSVHAPDVSPLNIFAAPHSRQLALDALAYFPAVHPITVLSPLHTYPAAHPAHDVRRPAFAPPHVNDPEPQVSHRVAPAPAYRLSTPAPLNPHGAHTEAPVAANVPASHFVIALEPPQ